MIASQLFHKVAKAHAQYEVDSMSLDELKSAAMDSRLSEMFNAAGSIDRESLLENLLQRFDGDTDAVRRYMVEQGGFDPGDAKAVAAADGAIEKAIAEFMA